ncbi:MAG TPA: nuclear transport factor 2 family protein [Gammaproteobacteria bacterium]|nr:nuclear transport factor 2 family protein [Gammaproteobacteria bacterium]
MSYGRATLTRTAVVLCCALLGVAASAQDAANELQQRLDRLELQVTAGEDISAIKRLQRTYGYYLDKGMWEDLSQFYTDDAVTNYPAGVYIGKESIRRHLFMNVGGGSLSDIGLPDGRLYNHMNIQPVIHLDPGGQTAKGRWRAFAMFGGFGGGATWAEGVYEMTYAKDNGVWKIKTLDYHSGFGASYATGWVPPEPRPAGAGGRGPRNLPHPADRPRDMPCEGFPAACIAPFHYANPGTSDGGHVWTTIDTPASGGRRGDARDRASDLAHRALLLSDEQEIENLQKIYGYYLDRRMWDEVADLFAADGTIEMGLRGVYVGKERVRAFLDLLGPEGLKDGELNDHVQLQVVVDVARDGRTAKSRSRELNMTGVHESHGEWSEGIYENSFVKENGVWKFKALRYFPTFITDYDQGWAKDAKPVPTASTTLAPDRPPTSVYEIYPKAHIPPYHYDNPVSGKEPSYPAARGRPSDAAIAAVRAAVDSGGGRVRRQQSRDVEALIAETERQIGRVKDFHELDNLESAYGYYLDKNLWNDLANLFAADGSMELAQRGVYSGRERVRGFLFNVFGKEGPTEGRLGNHVQWQPVIHVAPDGQTAKIRSRMMQQLNFGPRASMGASLYENEAVKENGVWKFSVVHTYNTWTAGYDGGWARSAGRGVPGPSKTYPPDAPPTFVFQMFPTVYDIPFHYPNPVSGRQVSQTRDGAAVTGAQTASFGGMPPEIETQLRAIGARIEVQETTELYAPLQPKEPYSWLSVTRDVAYGTHERNVLDVFTSPDTGSGKPVVVFVHGGGFARGAKRAPDSPFYDNVMLWAVGNGLVGVNINYRLAPEHMWPSGIEDLTALMGWLKSNVARYGGDPNKIFLWGHSAGAAHVADYVAHAAMAGRESGAAGAILTSGFYDLGTEVSVWKAYYGEDLSTYAERSSLPGLLKTTTPLLVTDAELDPEMFQVETNKLAAARAQIGKPVRRAHLAGHSHISETYAVGTADRTLSAPVLDFVRSISGAAGT